MNHHEMTLAVSKIMRFAIREIKDLSLEGKLTMGKSTAIDLYHCMYNAAVTNDNFLHEVKYFRKCDLTEGKLTVEFYK